MPSTFHGFPNLPAELRLKIWEEASSGPAMHTFDVCFPSRRGSERSRRAFEDEQGNMSDAAIIKWTKYRECVFLDAVEVGERELGRDTRVARHAHDPSAHRLLQAQRLASSEAFAAVRSRRDTNTVYLPGRNEKIMYDNNQDVLFLRFRDGGALTELSQGVLFGEFEASASGISEVLEGPWSAEMADTLRGARRIALDVAETWTPGDVGGVLIEEIAYLACCLQEGLRILYLVDHCVGRCTGCAKGTNRAQELGNRGELYMRLHCFDARGAVERGGDVIKGVGKVYREIFDLEGLGWSDTHPSYVFAMALGEMIRSQQADADARNFLGVRVLVVEDEEVDGLDTTTLVDCRPKEPHERMMETAWETNMRWSS